MTGIDGAPTEYRFGEVTVACSSVDRVVFPAVGITKGELIAYYHDVAGVMVPGLRGRPLTIERYTKGLAGGGFYQKHYQKHFPEWIDKVSTSGGGKRTAKKTAAPTPGTIVHPICNDAKTLVYLANQGTIAFHVGTATRDALDHPDEIVFDLDPPEGGFDMARRAARAIRGLMEEIDLPAFVKTSGSKGLRLRDIGARLAKHGDPWEKRREHPGAVAFARAKLGDSRITSAEPWAPPTRSGSRATPR